MEKDAFIQSVYSEKGVGEREREREREMREQWERNARLRLPGCDDSGKALQLCSTQLEDGGSKWGVRIPIFHFAGPD